jgi:membrane associated rhomboid family serine protease
MKKLRLQYNAPVVLTFALISLISLILGAVTGGRSTQLLFCVYRASLRDPLTYVRMFTHVLGHANYSHFMGNMMLFLVVGPPLEEKYGSSKLLACILLTALVSGLVQFIFFPGTALLGASGIVFMMIVLSSLSGMREGAIPLTLILVVFLYLGGEVVDALTQQDNVSQLTHIVGGLCGAVLGFAMFRNSRGK